MDVSTQINEKFVSNCKFVSRPGLQNVIYLNDNIINVAILRPQDEVEIWTNNSIRFGIHNLSFNFTDFKYGASINLTFGRWRKTLIKFYFELMESIPVYASNDIRCYVSCNSDVINTVDYLKNAQNSYTRLKYTSNDPILIKIVCDLTNRIITYFINSTKIAHIKIDQIESTYSIIPSVHATNINSFNCELKCESLVSSLKDLCKNVIICQIKKKLRKNRYNKNNKTAKFDTALSKLTGTLPISIINYLRE